MVIAMRQWPQSYRRIPLATVVAQEQKAPVADPAVRALPVVMQRQSLFT